MGGRGSGRKPKKDPDFAKGRAIYERQPFESDPAWNAFVVYRDMGPDRTVEKAVREARKKPSYSTTMSRWSQAYGWVKRCAAWDRKLDDAARKGAEKEAAAQAKKKIRQMAKVAEGMYLLAGGDLELWHAKMAKAKAKAKKAGKDAATPILNPKDIKGLADTGIKLARMLDGNPGEITEQRTTTFADLARKAKGDQ